MPHVHERDAFWEMKRKAKPYKSLTTMKKIHMPKTAVQVSSLQLSPPSSVSQAIWHIWWLAIVGFAGMIITWIVKSFDGTWITTCRWQKSKNWKTSISMEITKAGLKNGN